jgi:hypothetical protein
MLKRLFWTQIVALGEFWAIFSRLKFRSYHWAIFSRKKFAQCQNISPKWRNFAQSGHPVDKGDSVAVRVTRLGEWRTKG